MRKALFLTILLSLAACSGSDSDDSESLTSANPATTGDDSAGGGSGNRGHSSDSASEAAPIVATSGPSGAGGVAGGMTATGSVGGTIGGGAFAGGGGASAAAPGSGAPVVVAGGVSAPVTPPADPAAPRVPSTSTDAGVAQPTQQSRALTAGAWDDNLNYERFRSFLEKVKSTRQSGILPIEDKEFELAHTLFKADQPARSKLDVALVIDTTGSMGDEIAYLQREFTALSRAIELAYPAAQQRWALVVYKDQGDEYVTRTYDFRDDLEDFRQKLALQTASGGGDFPEAPEAAFEAMNQFAWRAEDDVARLAFWVADAPHHDNKAMAMARGIRDAQGQRVHVYPVASSGIDEFTELGMRSAAQLTGGRYLFLTNDSGIGGDHKEPSIPCYFVTSLTDAITRMVAIELSGQYRQPEAQQIIRTGGDPKDGACTLASGTMLQVF